MRELLFSISKLELIGQGEALVGGRCCGDMIYQGDAATRMVLLELGERVLVSREILIQFRRIQMYGREVDRIEPGWTAGIVIPDVLAADLKLTWTLAGENA